LHESPPWSLPGSKGVPSSLRYLQPGVVVVCPGGWHFPTWGPELPWPPPLLPGPNAGSANAGGATIAKASTANPVAIVLRLCMIYLLLATRGRPRLGVVPPYGWLPGPPWLLHELGRSALGPVHWPDLPAPLPPLVGGEGDA